MFDFARIKKADVLVFGTRSQQDAKWRGQMCEQMIGSVITGGLIVSASYYGTRCDTVRPLTDTKLARPVEKP
jgi:hypothetical protein